MWWLCVALSLMAAAIHLPILLGVALSLVTFAGVLWQVDRAGALRDGDARAGASKQQEQVSLPRLICPLH